MTPSIRCIAFGQSLGVAVKEEFSPQFRNRFGIAIAMRTYNAYRDLLGSERWQKLALAGARGMDS